MKPIFWKSVHRTWAAAEKGKNDFERSLGEEVEIRTYRMIDRQKEFTGILKSYDKETVTIEMEDTQERTFEKSEIALIRLAFDF